jgi:FkbM family methyltransferase
VNAHISTKPHFQQAENFQVNWLERHIALGLLHLRPAFVASFLKRALLFKRKNVSTPEGTFFVDIASNLGYPLLIAGEYEPHMVHVIKSCLKPGNMFIDLGANEGIFSVIASNVVGRAGRVLAIEPQSRLQSIIRKNLSLNGCENVEVLAVAINAESKPVTLNLSPDMNTGSTSVTRTTRYPLLKQQVAGVTLSELFQQQSIAICDLIKIDIEGYEYEAILGSSELFRSHRIKVIALELHPEILLRRNLSTETITDFLIDCGYRTDPSFLNMVFVSPDHELAN